MQRRDEILSLCGADDAIARIAGAMLDIARELADETPRPRGDPFFGLDASADYDLGVFDPLPSRGMFRKYEFVLDLGCGLGGRARWLAGRTGCRVVGVDSSPALVQAANHLNQRAYMWAQVSFEVARLQALGFAADSFSHVWMIDVAKGEPLLPIAREALRVLRKGGHLVWQLDRSDGERFTDPMPMLRELGLVDLEALEVSLPDLSSASRAARGRLREALKRSWPDARVCEALWEQHQSRRVLQVFGRRPA